jgi:uncharacterized protein DUF4386
MTMSADQIAEERRRGRYVGAAAIAAGLLYPGGVLWSRSVTSDIPKNNAPAELRFFDRHASEILASSALTAIGTLLLAVVAFYLYRATKLRKPELNPVVLVVGIFGPVALALGGVALNLFLASAASDFTSRQFQSIDVAEDLSNGPLRVLSVALIVSGTAAVAFWFVTGSLNAMRVGLLPRFMGILGIIIGPALLVVAPTPTVMAFWLVAVGVLFLGYWPRGLPPAWKAGEAVPWPSSREPQAAPEAEGASRDGEVEAVGPGVRGSNGELGEDVREAHARAKRKRKRRR